jgi:hypothetical protein
MAGQFIKEKVGKAKPTEEPEDFRAMVKQYQANKSELNKLHDATKALLKLNAQQSDAETAFSAGLHSCCVSTSGTPIDNGTAQLVGSLFPVLHGMAQDRKAYNDALVQMTAGIEKIVASDISATDKLISKLDNARLDHDAKLNKVASLKESKNPKPEDLKNAEAASAAANTEYEAAKAALAKSCQEVAAKKAAVFADHIPVYRKALLTFYQDCFNTISSGLQKDEAKSSGASVSAAAAVAPGGASPSS